MRNLAAVALGCLLAASILLLWVPARWPASMLQVGVFVLAMAWCARRVTWRTSIALLPLGAAVLWILLQLATGRTIYRWETWNALLAWATHFTIFLLALQIFPDPVPRSRFLRAAIAFGGVLAVVSTLQLYTAQGHIFWLFDSGYRDVVMGPFVYQNQYAAFIELLLPAALLAAFTDKRGAIVYAVTAAIMYASVIASGSRAGFVLATAELLLLVVLRARGRAAMLLLIAGTMAGAFGWDLLWQRLHNPDPFDIRRQFLQSSLEMFRAHPWMGFGLGTWPTAYPAYAKFDRGFFANQAHNDWAQWACEGGWPFAALMLWIAIWSLRASRRALWGIGAVAVFVHCLVDYPIQRPGLGGTFFLFLGLLASAEKSGEKALDVL
jgi:hypothetical protein